MDDINAWVANRAAASALLRDSYTGLYTADRWANPDSRVLSIPEKGAKLPSGIVYEDRFTNSKFLDHSEGAGLRDLIVNGTSLKTRGYRGRPVLATFSYHFKVASALSFPEFSVDLKIDPALNGSAEIVVRPECDESSLTAKAEAGSADLRISTSADDAWKSVKSFQMFLTLRGDAGSAASPAVQINAIRIGVPPPEMMRPHLLQQRPAEGD
jgi:hypothetical protein